MAHFIMGSFRASFDGGKTWGNWFTSENALRFGKPDRAPGQLVSSLALVDQFGRPVNFHLASLSEQACVSLSAGHTVATEIGSESCWIKRGPRHLRHNTVIMVSDDNGKSWYGYVVGPALSSFCWTSLYVRATAFLHGFHLEISRAEVRELRDGQTIVAACGLPPSKEMNVLVRLPSFMELEVEEEFLISRRLKGRRRCWETAIFLGVRRGREKLAICSSPVRRENFSLSISAEAITRFKSGKSASVEIRNKNAGRVLAFIKKK